MGDRSPVEDAASPRGDRLESAPPPSTRGGQGAGDVSATSAAAAALRSKWENLRAAGDRPLHGRPTTTAGEAAAAPSPQPLSDLAVDGDPGRAAVSGDGACSCSPSAAAAAEASGRPSGGGRGRRSPISSRQERAAAVFSAPLPLGVAEAAGGDASAAVAPPPANQSGVGPNPHPRHAQRRRGQGRAEAAPTTTTPPPLEWAPLPDTLDAAFDSPPELTPRVPSGLSDGAAATVVDSIGSATATATATTMTAAVEGAATDSLARLHSVAAQRIAFDRRPPPNNSNSNNNHNSTRHHDGHERPQQYEQQVAGAGGLVADTSDTSTNNNNKSSSPSQPPRSRPFNPRPTYHWRSWTNQQIDSWDPPGGGGGGGGGGRAPPRSVDVGYDSDDGAGSVNGGAGSGGGGGGGGGILEGDLNFWVCCEWCGPAMYVPVSLVKRLWGRGGGSGGGRGDGYTNNGSITRVNRGRGTHFSGGVFAGGDVERAPLLHARGGQARGDGYDDDDDDDDDDGGHRPPPTSGSRLPCWRRARRELRYLCRFFDIFSTASAHNAHLPAPSRLFCLLHYGAAVALVVPVVAITVRELPRVKRLTVDDGTACQNHGFSDRLRPDLSSSLCCLVLNAVCALWFALRAARYEKSGFLVACGVVVALQLSRVIYFSVFVAPRYFTAATWAGSKPVLALLYVSTGLSLAATALSFRVRRGFGWRSFMQGITRPAILALRRRYMRTQTCLQLDAVATLNTYLSFVFLSDSTRQQITAAAVTVAVLLVLTSLMPLQRATRRAWPLAVALLTLLCSLAYCTYVIGVNFASFRAAVMPPVPNSTSSEDSDSSSSSDVGWVGAAGATAGGGYELLPWTGTPYGGTGADSRCYRPLLVSCLALQKVYIVSLPDPPPPPPPTESSAASPSSSSSSSPSSTSAFSSAASSSWSVSSIPTTTSSAPQLQQRQQHGAAAGHRLPHTINATAAAAPLTLDDVVGEKQICGNRTSTFLPTAGSDEDEYFELHGCGFTTPCFPARWGEYRSHIHGCCVGYGLCNIKDSYRSYGVTLLVFLTLMLFVVRIALAAFAYGRVVAGDDAAIAAFYSAAPRSPRPGALGERGGCHIAAAPAGNHHPPAASAAAAVAPGPASAAALTPTVVRISKTTTTATATATAASPPSAERGCPDVHRQLQWGGPLGDSGA